MERCDVFQEINRIREEQNAKWPRDERRIAMYSYMPPHILLLEKQIEKLRDEWYASKTEDCINRFQVIAALAVRALEEIEPFQ
jgi:hypothetical protein